MTSIFLLAFLLTVLVEISVAFLFGFKNKKAILAVVFINLITNPMLNYFLIINNYFSFVFISAVTLLVLEVIIVLVEWLLLVFVLRQSFKKLLVLSIAMNFCSYFVGVLISKF
jgi:hypothetical protein